MAPSPPPTHGLAGLGGADAGCLVAQFVGDGSQPPPGDSDIMARPPTVGEAVNNAANVVYSAIPWGKAVKNPYILAVKGGSFVLKALTPEYEAFYSVSGRDQATAGLLNELIVLSEGVDIEDVAKFLTTRGVITELKDYFFGDERGGVQLTRTFYGDP